MFRNKTVIVLIFFAVALAAYGFWRFVLDAGQNGPPTLSAEVTAVTDPKFVDEDGYVDYLMALNNWRQQGVEPEENACVDLFRFFPPEADDIEDWRVRWKMISDQPEPTGPFFSANLKSGDPAITTVNIEAMGRPWLDEEFPDLAKWMVENQEVSKHLIAATLKRSFYNPCTLPEEAELLSIGSSHMSGPARSSARFLSIRAMNHFANDRVDECMSDLILIRTLGRLIEQKAFATEHLVGHAIAGIATHGERVMLNSGKLDRMQIRDYLQRLDQLIAYNRLAATFDNAERFILLSAIQAIHKDGIDGSIMGHDFINFPPRSFDLDIAMKVSNQVVDSLVATAVSEENDDPADDSTEFLVEMEAIENRLVSRAFLARALLGGSESKGQVAGVASCDVFLAGNHVLGKMDQKRKAEDRMARLAFLLELHWLANDEYPESLNDLDDKTQGCFVDPFTFARLKYVRTETGFRIYSLGENGQDDNGIKSSIMDNKPGTGDDLPFEIIRSNDPD